MLKKIVANPFFKNSLLYTLGSMITPIIGFIMLPFYTNVFTPAEYGVVTTTQSLIGLLQIFLVLSLHGAITRFFYDYLDQPKEQRRYLGSIFIFVSLFSTVFSSLLLIFNEVIGSFLFQDIPINPFYYLLILISWLSALLSLPLALFRAQEKAYLFVFVNFSKAVLIMLLSIYLIKYENFGPEGVLIAQASISAIVTLITYLHIIKYIDFNFSMQSIKESLLFSLPLIPHVASGWIISSSDKVILEKFVGVAEVGIYSLAVQISMVLGLFFASVNNALVPRYTKLKKMNQANQADKLLRIFAGVVVGVSIIYLPTSIIVIKYISSPEYHSAINIIPLLLIGQIVNGFYFIYVAKLFYAKKSGSIAFSSSTAAITNILLNIVLIPQIGIYGAAVSTIISEMVRFLLVKNSNKKSS